MNAFTSTMKTVGRTYRDILVGETGAATIKSGFHSAKSIAKTIPEQKSVGAKVTTAAKATSAGGKAFFKVAGTNIAGTIVAMEVIDYVEAKVNNRRREQIIAAIVQQVSKETDQAEKDRLTKDLRRQMLPPHRSFGQFMRDLPSRTVRRVYRACLFEVSFWFGVVTSPVWLTALAAYGVYAFGFVAPWALFRELRAQRSVIPPGATQEETIDILNYRFDTSRYLDRPGLITRAIVRATAGRSFRGMRRSLSMTMHDRTALYTGRYSHDLLDQVSNETFEETGNISNRTTAYAWGKRMAENIAVRESLDTMAKQSAIAVFQSWSVEHMAGDFVDDVQAGFKSGTPFYLRDLATS